MRERVVRVAELAGFYFPSFSEGLSLREKGISLLDTLANIFPFLFGGTFIEGSQSTPGTDTAL